MRIQRRNEQVFYYANPTGVEQITDTNGHKTGERRVVYGDAVKARGNISPATGSVSIEQFGSVEAYDKVIVMCEPDIDINMNTVFWIDVMPDSTPALLPGEELFPSDDLYPAEEIVEQYDYIIGHISRSLNSVSIAVKKVDVQ